jgi:ABC-type hemin transport system ATPase subunit
MAYRSPREVLAGFITRLDMPPSSNRHHPLSAKARVGELIMQLKAQGIGIFLISHDIHDVFDLADRVVVMKNGRVVLTADVHNVTKDEVLGMIILGKCPPGAIPGPGAISAPIAVPV